MNKTIALALLTSSAVAALALAACSNSSSGPADGGTNVGNDAGGDATTTTDSGTNAGDSGAKTDSGTTADAGDGGTLPPPPTLGTQIDRLGRPAVNTALNHVFDTDAGTAGMAKDTYNADKMPSDWNAYVPEFEKNLAVYDGLDTVCGNQPAFMDGGSTPNYTLLATVLSADALWLNTGTTTCNQYLGVEIDFLNPTAPKDCGGRTPTENVVDTTYNTVAGTLNIVDGGASQGPLTNGITQPDPSQTPSNMFPYLVAPHPAMDAGATSDAGADSGPTDAGGQ